MKTWMSRIIWGGVVAALTGYLVITRPWSQDEATIKFQTVSVGKGAISAQVTANGALSARSTILVGAQVSGRVVEIHADFNDRVKKNQVIAKLDDTVLKVQIEQTQAAYQLAIANQRKAEVAVMDGERQWKRQKGLQDQQLIAGATVEQFEVTMETARASLAAARAQVSQAAANLKQNRTNLSYATIYSPVDGVVLSRAVDVGQTVAASLQAPTLFTIAEDLARMQINTAVSESDVGRLTEGMKATFTVDAFSGKSFEGVVRQIRNSPTTTQGVVTYDAVIDVDNKALQLKPGMTANVTFVLDQVADAVKIPNAALRFRPSPEQMRSLAEAFGSLGRRGGESNPRVAGLRPEGPPGGASPRGSRLGDKRMVWKLVDGKPTMVLIKPGLTDGSSTQMLEGDLQPADQLITEVTGLVTNARKIGAF